MARAAGGRADRFYCLLLIAHVSCLLGRGKAASLDAKELSRVANLAGVKAGDTVIRTIRCGPNTFDQEVVVTKVGRVFAYVGKCRFYISNGVESSDRFGADVLRPKSESS